jgi:signal peptidase II
MSLMARKSWFNSRLRAVLLIALVVLLDRGTKLYIRANWSDSDLVPVIRGIFNIVHVENPGAAFGMFSSGSRLILIGISVTVMVIVAGMLWKQPTGPGHAMVQSGLALVFGGALGNFWDRVFRGTVTDFLQFFIGSYEFPSFNVADMAINVGAGLLVLDLLLHRKDAADSAAPTR